MIQLIPSISCNFILSKVLDSSSLHHVSQFVTHSNFHTNSTFITAFNINRESIFYIQELKAVVTPRPLPQISRTMQNQGRGFNSVHGYDTGPPPPGVGGFPKYPGQYPNFQGFPQFCSFDPPMPQQILIPPQYPGMYFLLSMPHKVFCLMNSNLSQGLGSKVSTNRTPPSHLCPTSNSPA